MKLTRKRCRTSLWIILSDAAGGAGRGGRAAAEGGERQKEERRLRSDGERWVGADANLPSQIDVGFCGAWPIYV